MYVTYIKCDENIIEEAEMQTKDWKQGETRRADIEKFQEHKEFNK